MFRKNESGSIAAIFAVSLPVLLAGVASAVEITRAEGFKQRLTSATEMACTQSAIRVSNSRQESVANSLLDYSATVKTIYTNNLQLKKLASTDYVVVQPQVGPTATNIHLEATGTVKYLLGAFLPSSAAQFVVKRDCVIPLNTGGEVSELKFSESFERESGHNVAINGWDVLKNWHGWQTTNAGIEINGQPALSGSTIRNGYFFAELDSDCGTSANQGVSNCQSNSAMTRLQQMTAGTWEIRYLYIARHGYVNTTAYGTQPICSDLSKPQGSQRGDFASQASSNLNIKAAEGDGETFRIEVYVDTAANQLFKPQNLIDACIWADTWLERSIKFTISNPGDYYVSWRAAGRQDTYGGLIDYIRICRGSCP